MAKRVREKSLKRQQEKDTRPYAIVRYVRVSPTKAQPVANTVRGKSYDEAVGILSSLPNDAARVILKLVNSAAANAEHNKNMNRHDLFVDEIFVGNGPIRQNRFNIRGRGHGPERVTTRTSHITVVLDSAK